jgi:hypothetical protein
MEMMTKGFHQLEVRDNLYNELLSLKDYVIKCNIIELTLRHTKSFTKDERRDAKL